MKLLLDENLSRRVVPALQAKFPGSDQVTLYGLTSASDAELCDFAAREGFVICSKDDDFHRLVAAPGYRAKLVHLASGTASNCRVLRAVLAATAAIEAAPSEPGRGVVIAGLRHSRNAPPKAALSMTQYR